MGNKNKVWTKTRLEKAGVCGITQDKTLNGGGGKQGHPRDQMMWQFQVVSPKTGRVGLGGSLERNGDLKNMAG